ncbi:hypothetical protein BJ508DRAFT_379262 [Ascobolus immersus RN42]|uniref:Uncharacterized protein n=1 Tax=Ascobolus immersus RN42 TaxID=1160509 RepID=A0A3N4I4T9_ASCIM|nr:hypothetical protein BJ508DRAFT_379262 [Ascobolus immersus RN42]
MVHVGRQGNVSAATSAIIDRCQERSPGDGDAPLISRYYLAHSEEDYLESKSCVALEHRYILGTSIHSYVHLWYTAIPNRNIKIQLGLATVASSSCKLSKSCHTVDSTQHLLMLRASLHKSTFPRRSHQSREQFLALSFSTWTCSSMDMAEKPARQFHHNADSSSMLATCGENVAKERVQFDTSQHVAGENLRASELMTMIPSARVGSCLARGWRDNKCVGY